MFAKAKIHRFNEDVSCAPPPGAYDPKYDDKGKAIPIVIHTAERFRERKISPESRSLCSSTESIESVGSSVQASFRTPQLMRRKIPLTPALSSSKLDGLLSRPVKGCSLSSCEYKHKLLSKQRDIDELKELQKALEDEINQLKEDIVNREKENESTKETLEKHVLALSDSHTDLSTKLHKAEILLSLKTEDLNELHMEKKRLESLIEQKQQTILSVQAALSNYSLEKSDMKKDYEEEISRLKREIGDLRKDQETEIDKLVKKNLLEYEKHKDLIEELEDKMKNERHEYSTQISELEEKIEDLEADMIEKEGFSSDLQEQLVQLRSENDELVSQVTELQKKMNNLEAEIREKEVSLSIFEDQVKCLENRIEEVEAEREACMKKLETSEAEVKVKEAHAEDLQVRLSSLQRRVDDVLSEKNRMMIENANTMLELSLQHEERLQTMRESFENRLQALKSNMTEDENNYRGLQAWIGDKLDSLQDKVALDLQTIETDYQTKLDDISNSYSTAENKMKNLRCILHSRISKYTTDTESKYNQIFDRLAGKKKRAEAERDSLKITNENYETTIQKLETNLEEAQKDCKKFELASNNARAAVDALSAHLSQSVSQVEALQKTERILMEENEKLAELLRDKENTFNILEKTMNELQNAMISETQEIHDKLQGDVDNLKQMAKAQKEMYEEKLEESLKCRLQLEDRINETDAVIRGEKNKIRILETELENKIKDNSELMETLGQISTKVTSFCSSPDAAAESSCDFTNIDRCLENARNNVILIDQLKATLSNKEERVQEVETNYKELLNKFEALENQTNDLRLKKEEHLEEFDKLKEEMDLAHNLINCLKAEKDSLNYRISELHSEIESLTQLNADKERTNESLAKDLDLKKATIEILSRDNDQLSATLENQQCLLLEANKTLEEKQNEIVELEASVDSFYDKLKEKEDLRNLVVEKEKLIKDLMKEKNQTEVDYTEKVQYLENQNSEYFERLQEQEKISQCLKEELNLLDSEKNVNQGLKNEIERLVKQVEQLQDEKESLKVVASRSSCNLQMMSDKLTDYNKLEKKIEELEAELKMKVEKIKDVEKNFETITKRKNEYKEYAFEYKEGAENQERAMDELKKKCAELEKLIGPFRNLLEDFERENKLLESKNEAHVEEKKSLLLKFADLLGHQNPKQKIKHINKIIEDNNKMLQENQELSKENEKLKKQLRKFKSTEKLNIENGLNSLKIEGNLSPRLPRVDKTPLRERN